MLAHGLIRIRDGARLDRRGLGITHVLSSLGSAVHRIRGHGRPLRLVLNYLVWIGFMFGWLVQFWKYFLSIRPWFFAGVLILNGIDLIATFLKGAAAAATRGGAGCQLCSRASRE